MFLYNRLWSNSRTNIFAYVLNKCSVQFLQDDEDKMELSNVFYMKKFISFVVITVDIHYRQNFIDYW